MKLFGIAAILLIALTLTPQLSRACWVCEKPADLADALKRYPVVFIGTAVKVNREVTQFKVVENFGVELPKEVTMNASQNAGCGFVFTQGRKYLVFTTAAQKTGLLNPATTCNRTSAIADAADDITTLRGSSSRRQRSTQGLLEGE